MFSFATEDKYRRNGGSEFSHGDGFTFKVEELNHLIVKLREREGQGVDPGRSLKGHLWMVDGGWWISFP